MRGCFLLVAWLATIVPLFSSALNITKIVFRDDITRPGPGSIVFWEVDVLDSDPAAVQVLLADVNDLGTNLTIFPSFDFKDPVRNSPNAGGPIPTEVEPGFSYVLFMTPTANATNVLAISPVFQIWPEEHVVETTATPSPSSTPSSLPKEEESESELPLGTIVGGSVGGFAILVLFIVLLYFLLRKPRPKQHPAPIIQPPPNNPQISPFVLPVGPTAEPAHSGHPETYPLTPSSQGYHSRTDFNSSSNEKAGLRAQQRLRDRYGHSSASGSTQTPPRELSDPARSMSGSSDNLLAQPSGGDHYATSVSGSEGRGQSQSSGHRRGPSLKTAAMRADQLRRERERIDREIAELEDQSVYSGTGSGSVTSGSRANRMSRDEVQSQIAALRSQMQRMEREREVVGPGFDEPPPEYVPRTSLAGPSVGASPSTSYPADSKARI